MRPISSIYFYRGKMVIGQNKERIAIRLFLIFSLFIISPKEILMIIFNIVAGSD